MTLLDSFPTFSYRGFEGNHPILNDWVVPVFRQDDDGAIVHDDGGEPVIDGYKDDCKVVQVDARATSREAIKKHGGERHKYGAYLPMVDETDDFVLKHAAGEVIRLLKRKIDEAMDA